MSRSARFPWRDGLPTHLPCRPGDVSPRVLLPGDPDRVRIAAGVLDAPVLIGQRREFAMARGDYAGHAVGVCSTGIGGPSTEIAVVELANLGVTTAIRVGGMGAIDPDLPLGGFVIVEAATGGTGAAGTYRRGDGPVRATPKVVEALEAAARRLGLPHRRGVIHTTDSYYWGQERPAFPDADVPTDGLIRTLIQRGVCGLDMETEALLAVGGALGLSVGAVLAVHGNRATDRWLEDYEPTQADLIRLAATAAALIAETDP